MTDSLRINLERDQVELADTVMKPLREAVKAEDEEGILTWFREAIKSADSRSRYLKGFDILIDNRNQTVNVSIEQIREEIVDDLCDECKRKVLDKRMAAKAKDVTP